MQKKYLIFLLLYSLLFSIESKFVFKVDFTGESYFPETHLKDKIRLKSRGFLSKSEFNYKKLHLDEISIKNYYKTHGFIDIKVKTIITNFDEENINIEFQITEGSQYLIDKINFHGIKSINNKKVNDLFNIQNGDVYNPAQLRISIKEMKNYYLSNGKINISIVEDIQFINNKTIIDIFVQEGSTFHIINYTISGLKEVKEKYIEREITFKKGDLYNINLIDESRNRIFESGLFSSVEIIPEILSDTELNLSIQVREYKSRELDAQIGFNQLPSSYGDFPISAVNTKLQWQLGQLFNSASSVKLKSEIGVSYDSDHTFLRENYELYYNSPWLMAIRIPINFKLFYENIKQNEEISKFGINTSFYYINSERFRLNGQLKTEFINSNDIESAEERSLSLSYSHFNVKNFLNPQFGYYLSVLPSIHGTLLGGNYHYFKIETELKYYYTIFENITFASRCKYGSISNFEKSTEIPSFDKFHLGGQSTLRGWSSPTELEGETLDGGIERLLINLEIRSYLVSVFGTELFFDWGTLKSDNSEEEEYWDVGYGVIIHTGLGPIRVDSAFKNAKGKPTILFSLLYMF
jgi:outer membrane protein assembly factor BamA